MKSLFSLLFLLCLSSIGAQQITVQNDTFRIPDHLDWGKVREIPDIGPVDFTVSEKTIPFTFASGAPAQDVVVKNFVSADGLVSISQNSNGESVILSMRDGSECMEISKVDGVYVQRCNTIAPPAEWCGTPDEGLPYTVDQLTSAQAINDRCVRWYFEVDHPLIAVHGGLQETIDFISGALAQVWILMDNDAINTEISEVFVWDTPSVYQGSNTGGVLGEFINRNPAGSYNGDAAHLLSNLASGGIATLGGICTDNVQHAYSSIQPTYSLVPAYSWTIMVIAHEMGHVFGSRHTHACVWNGNGTAIDGCAGFTEGNCGNPGIPPNGGGIMSYCHLATAGINFNVGFGNQPATLIRNNIASLPCLGSCDTVTPPPVICEEKVVITVVPDAYPGEVSYTVTNQTGDTLLSKGPWSKDLGYTAIRDSFCGETGCYVFRITDIDGLTNDFCDPGYYVVEVDGDTVRTGAQFTEFEEFQFCFGDATDCAPIPMSPYYHMLTKMPVGRPN